MSFRHGRSSYFQLDNSAGSLVDLSNRLDEVSISRSVETGEITTFGANAKSYIVGLADGTISISGKFHSDIDAHIQGVIAALSAGTLASASWQYRASSATASATNPQYSGEALITSYEVSSSVSDVVTFSLELQITGDVTRTV